MQQYSQSSDGPLNLKPGVAFINLITRKYMVPTVVSIFGSTVVAFANSMLAGHFLGSDALAGFNIANPLTFLFAVIGCIVNIGGSISASVEMGKEDYDNVSGYVSLSLVLTLSLSILTTIIGFIFLKPFVLMSQASGVVYETAVTFGSFVLLSGTLTALMYYVFNYIRLDGRGSYSMLIYSLMAIIDITLAFVFLKVGLGVIGIGLAVFLSTLIADIAGLLILFKNKASTIKLGRITQLKEKLLNIWRKGAASGINNLCNLLRTTCLNILILRYFGAFGLSVYAIVCAIINFTQASVVGAGQTAGALVGVFYGGKDYLSIKEVLKSSLRIALVTQGITFILACLLSKNIAGWFGIQSADQLQAASIAIIWVCASFIPAASNNILVFYLSAVNRPAIASIATFIKGFGLICVLFALLGGADLGMHVYSVFLITELITFLGLMFLIYPSLKNQEDIYDLEFSLKVDGEAAVYAGQAISKFLDDKDTISFSTKMAIPLALEELLVSISEHTKKISSNTEADVRIALGDDEVMLRIRCGGEIFDPIKYYFNKKNTLSEEELLEDDSLGIKIITQICKEIRFERTFGVNNLTLLMSND